MFDTVRDYIYQRRKGLATAAGVLGALYLTGHYVLERLEEIREQVMQEKTARENLRRRFQQNQQDCTYTILALVPTLGERILEEMDVEGVTFTLQMQSKTAKSRLENSAASDVNTSSLSLITQQPSVTSTLELSMPNHNREEHEAQPSSSSSAGDSSRSWVDQFHEQNSDSLAREEQINAMHQGRISPGSSFSAQLSDSVTSASASLISGSDGERSGAMVESMHSTVSESGGSQVGTGADGPIMTTRSKGELWREVKILTFTRTLTVLYSTTLLSLLTHIQLNLLGRYKYVQSILDMEREEKLRDRQTFEASLSGLFWGGGDLEGALEGLEDHHIKDPLGLFGSGRTGGTERKYLTLSWWLVHVGWRDIGDRVRKAVEIVLERIPLKAKLDAEDLKQLFADLRQRIEFDNSPSEVGEDSEAVRTLQHGRRLSFLPSLIPPTPESLKDVLVQGGLPDHLTSLEDTEFLQLVDETRTFVSSADFGRVLEVCLDHATELMFEGLRRTLFTENAGVEGTSADEKIRLAGLLPGVARWSHAAIYGTPNELVEGLADLRELAGFSAIIYSSYEDSFR